MGLILLGLTLLITSAVMLATLAGLETRDLFRRREFEVLHASSMGPISSMGSMVVPRAIAPQKAKTIESPKPAAELYESSGSQRLSPISERWPVGSLVAPKGEDLKKSSVRVLLGYRPGGECTTAWLDPPPWQQQKVLVERVTHLSKLEPRVEPECGYRKDVCKACPVVAACEFACADTVTASVEKQCFMNKNMHPAARRLAIAG